MPQNGQSAQQKNFRNRVKVALLTHSKIHNVSALARKVGRPRTSVSRAINNGVFPELQKQIEKALGLT